MAQSIRARYLSSRLLREGRAFRALLAILRRNERLSFDELIELQTTALARQSRAAARAIPAYRETFREHLGSGRVPETLGDLARLPVMTKQQLQGNEERFMGRSLLRVKALTSGTTGTPLRLYRDYRCINFENAMLWRQRNWAGVQLEDRRAILRGEIVTDASRTKPPYWVESLGGRELILSSYHISPASIRQYVDALRQFDAACLEAYPSSAFALAQLMEEMDIEPLGLKAVITSSETLLSRQRQLIEKKLGRLYDYYGNAERVAFISTCENGNYHYMMDYGIVEFLPTERDGARQIVGTSLGNRLMPLYRYATGDSARLSGASCACGRAFPVVDEIAGRLEDVIHTPSGRAIARLDSVFKGVDGVRESQIIQDRLDHLVVRIVPGAGYTRAAELQIRDHLNDRLSGEMLLDFEIVDKIPRSASGKFRFLVSRIS